MAKNLGREYAAMTEDERREFELKRAEESERGAPDEESEEELELDDPRRYPPSRGPSGARAGQAG